MLNSTPSDFRYVTQGSIHASLVGALRIRSNGPSAPRPRMLKAKASNRVATVRVLASSALVATMLRVIPMARIRW
ncbi:hypothetical protein QF035_009728 [Streptomyces umbrinus]|uniref:Uncharacterized protein n=1 Tax=Streptomyces umbrinus TaxID=67370 RepID=A0ABU0T8K7_9ACTN|nr:hypothetical protein [Streptomyces umbrinus]